MQNWRKIGNLILKWHLAFLDSVDLEITSGSQEGIKKHLLVLAWVNWKLHLDRFKAKVTYNWSNSLCGHFSQTHLYLGSDPLHEKWTCIKLSIILPSNGIIFALKLPLNMSWSYRCLNTDCTSTSLCFYNFAKLSLGSILESSTTTSEGLFFIAWY